MDLSGGVENIRVTHHGVRAHTAEGTGGRITQAGNVARSPEGTAAKGMAIKGHEDLWVEIQANTFRNWINEHLKSFEMKVVDLVEDLRDGTALCALVEALQGRRLRGWQAHPTNQHHMLENVTVALQAIEDDHVKLVNIGNTDIVNGNLKLILGLIWSLIFRYQIGRSKFPPRKLMLAWLQAALPESRVSNLTTDWNSGVLLSALLDYCRPGLFPHWRSLNPHEAVDNCSRAMNLAQREFDIPMVLEPEYLASPWLDELSGMTYLSYFMKPGSPGFQATLDWVNSKVEKPVSNFTTDWNDGRAACDLIRSLGGSAPPASRLKTDPARWEQNQQQAIDAGKKLGVQPILSAKDMSQKDVEHLGVMAYATQYRHVPPRPPLAELVRVALESTSGRVGEPMHMRVEVSSDEVDQSAVRTSVITPLEQTMRVRLDAHGDGQFVPEHAGMHEIVLDIDDVRIDNRFFFRVMPRLATAVPPGMAPCALGSIVEVLVSATGAPRREDIVVSAVSPRGRTMRLQPRHPLDAPHAASAAAFEPDEPGVWTIAITYQGKHIQGGPFTCDVFDPAGVKLSPGALDGAQPLKPHSFELDTSGCGAPGDLQLDIVHDKRSVMCALERLSDTKYRATFLPKAAGKHRLYIYFNGYDMKGSPFIMRVGSKSRSARLARESASPQVRTSPHVRVSPARVVSPGGRYRSESPMNGHNTYDFNKTKTSSYESHIKGSTDGYKSPTYDSYPDRSSASRDVVDSSFSSSRLNKINEIRNRESSPVYKPPILNDMYQERSGREAMDSIYSTTSKIQKINENRYKESSPGYKSPILNDTYQERAGSTGRDPLDSIYSTTSKVNKKENYYSSTKYSGGDSPRNRTASPITSKHLDSRAQEFHRGSSPFRASSPLGVPNSPLGRTTSPLGRTSSPLNRNDNLDLLRSSSPVRISSPVTSTRKVVEKSSNYRMYSSYTNSDDGLDMSSPLPTTEMDRSYRIGSPGGGPALPPDLGGRAGRHDSWDAINKTKHILSANSLESLATLDKKAAEDNWRSEYDSETRRNTERNRFGDFTEDSFNRQLDNLAEHREDSDTYVQGVQEYKTRRKHTSTKSERSTQYVVRDPSYSSVEDRHNSNNHQQSFLSNRPSHEQAGRASGGDSRDASLTETDAIHSRFRDLKANHAPKVQRGARGVVITPTNKGVVGQPVEFLVDGSSAGSGDLEIVVEGGGSLVGSSVRPLGGQRYRAGFEPQVPRDHTVSVTFNGKSVPGE